MSKRATTTAAVMAAVAATIVATPAVAIAHAFLKSAMPAVGSTGGAPTQVEITFTEGVEPNFTTITVQDAQGGRVDQGGAHLVGDDVHMAVGLKPLAPGVYKVLWHATAVDTHKTQGSFSFTVSP